MKRMPLALIALLALVTTQAHAKPLTWEGANPKFSKDFEVENVYKAIVGEAIGEGRDGMLLVASCFSNRLHNGESLGSAASKRKDIDVFIAKQPAALLEYAHHLAVRVVEGQHFDYVLGATRFESTDFPSPAWVENGEFFECMRHGKHVFYVPAF